MSRRLSSQAAGLPLLSVRSVRPALPPKLPDAQPLSGRARSNKPENMPFEKPTP